MESLDLFLTTTGKTRSGCLVAFGNIGRDLQGDRVIPEAQEKVQKSHMVSSFSP